MCTQSNVQCNPVSLHTDTLRISDSVRNFTNNTRFAYDPTNGLGKSLETSIEVPYRNTAYCAKIFVDMGLSSIPNKCEYFSQGEGVIVIHHLRKAVSNVILATGMIAAIWTVLGQSRLWADGPFIIDTWLEEPNLSVSYIWNLYERRDGWYIDSWSDEQLAAVDTFQFGMREAFKLMDMSDIIDAQHNSDAWIKLYNVATNAPNGSNDAPPHINVISYWGETGRQYEGDINGHFYPTPAGHLDTNKTWYAWDLAPNCTEGVRNPAINQWMQHVDRNCELLWEERVTASGEIEVRLNADSPVYLLRNKAPSDLDILRDGTRVRNVRRVFHNAWINYPTPYPDGTARVVWEIRDYESNTLTTETITAKPETGEIVSHERVNTPLDGSNSAPSVSIEQPIDAAVFNLGDEIQIVANAADGDGSVVEVAFFAGDQQLGTVSAAPWQWNWLNAPEGTHMLTARATDDDGAVTPSSLVSISLTMSNNVSMVVAPATRTIAQGEIFSMTIQVQTQGLPVDRVAGYLNFDASVIEVVQVTEGTALPEMKVNNFDNQAGHIDFVAAYSGISPPSEDFVLATVTFRAITADAQSILRFNDSASRQTAIFYNNTDYLSATSSGEISVIPLAGPTLYLPNVTSNE